MIEGVVVKPLRVIPDDRGRLMEVLRADDPLFEKFGQVYVTTAYPGVVKAWHRHRKQRDCLTVVAGMAKIALYDDRPDSATRGEVMEVVAGVHNPVLVTVPREVWHGFKCVSETECMVMNLVSECYDYKNPDEERVEPHGGPVPYDWARRDR